MTKPASHVVRTGHLCKERVKSGEDTEVSSPALRPLCFCASRATSERPLSMLLCSAPAGQTVV